MSFVMIATGAPSRARVHTLSMRVLVAVAVVGALLLLAGGAVLGYWLAATPPLPSASASAAAAGKPQGNALRSAAVLPFTLEQLGAVSARVYELESQAAHLAQRVRALQPGAKEAPLPVPRPPAQAASGAAGGPLLPPRPLSLTQFDDLQARLDQLEQRFALVADATAQRNLALLRLPSRLPLVGAVDMTSPFGNREDPFTHHLSFHPGIDFAAAYGSRILAAAGGVVTWAGPRTGYGNLVEIDHRNGLVTRYGHASRVLVKVGAVVAPGDPIALVGSTGRSTGPHVHFEVLRGGEPVNPRRYLAGL